MIVYVKILGQIRKFHFGLYNTMYCSRTFKVNELCVGVLTKLKLMYSMALMRSLYNIVTRAL